MVKLIFLSEQIEDIEYIKTCLLGEVLFITYNPLIDTIQSLEKIITTQIFRENTITNVGWIFHSPISSETDIKLFKNVELSNQPKKAHLKKLVMFFRLVETIIDSNYPRFDLISCCLLKNPKFEVLRNQLLYELSCINCKLQIAASDDLGGSIYYMKEISHERVIDSCGVNLIGEYFKPEIEKCKFNYKVKPVDYATSEEWQNAIDSMAGAILCTPSNTPLFNACSRICDILKDPTLHNIVGLNLMPYTVRMSEFVVKAVNGETTDSDIVMTILDSVSMLAAFAISSGSNSIRNIQKVKVLAGVLCSISHHNKDIVESVQILVENPNEKSIDTVANQIAKISISVGFSKSKIIERLTILEMKKRVDIAYDNIQSQINTKPEVVLFDEDNSIQIKQGTSMSCLVGKYSYIIIPSRTVVRIWSKTDFIGEFTEFCNRNWYEMKVSLSTIASSIICASISPNGDIKWGI